MRFCVKPKAPSSLAFYSFKRPGSENESDGQDLKKEKSNGAAHGFGNGETFIGRKAEMTMCLVCESRQMCAKYVSRNCKTGTKKVLFLYRWGSFSIMPWNFLLQVFRCAIPLHRRKRDSA